MFTEEDKKSRSSIKLCVLAYRVTAWCHIPGYSDSNDPDGELGCCIDTGSSYTYLPERIWKRVDSLKHTVHTNKHENVRGVGGSVQVEPANLSFKVYNYNNNTRKIEELLIQNAPVLLAFDGVANGRSPILISLKSLNYCGLCINQDLNHKHDVHLIGPPRSKLKVI